MQDVVWGQTRLLLLLRARPKQVLQERLLDRHTVLNFLDLLVLLCSLDRVKFAFEFDFDHKLLFALAVIALVSYIVVLSLQLLELASGERIERLTHVNGL